MQNVNDPVFNLFGTDLGLSDEPVPLGKTFNIMTSARHMNVIVDFDCYPVGAKIPFKNEDR